MNVYLLTCGSGEDGDEWRVESIHATREGADRAKVDYDTKRQDRSDGTFYFLTSNEIEEWEVQS